MSDAETDDLRMTLEPLRLAVATMLPPGLQQVSLDRDFVTNALAYRLSATAYGRTSTARSRTTVRVPATWWQHLKLSWLRAGSPFVRPDRVRYREVEVPVTAKLFGWWPDLALPTAQTGDPVVLVTQADASLYWEGA